MWADTHALPDEDIQVSSGLPQGWPSGMMGEETAKKLHAMGITKVSIICQDAISMDKAQFEAKYAHAWTKHHAVADYFARAVENPESMAELKRRLSAADPPSKAAPNVPRCPDGHSLVIFKDHPYFIQRFDEQHRCWVEIRQHRATSAAAATDVNTYWRCTRSKARNTRLIQAPPRCADMRQVQACFYPWQF